MACGLYLKTIESKIWRKAFCIISGTIYFLIAALRHFSVGNDTPGYVFNFLRMAYFGRRYAGVVYTTEPFFGKFLWFVNRIKPDYTFLFIIVAAIFCFFVWRFIYKHSKDPVLSVIILLAFNFYQFSLTGMRQTIAMAFILAATSCLREDKDSKGAFFILLASAFHLSSLVFALMLILKHIRLRRDFLWVTIPLLVCVFIFRNQIAEKFVFLMSDRGYEVLREGEGLTMTFVVFSLYVMCIVFAKGYFEKHEKTANFDFWVIFLATFFQMLVAAQPIFFRIGFYFLIAFTTIIPSLIGAIRKDGDRKLVSVSIYVLLSIQYLFFTIGSSGVLPYKFFWQ